MGTWGEGLYDNDSALDTLGDIFEAITTDTPARYVVSLGLRLWLHGEDPDELLAELDDRDKWRADFPRTRERIELSGDEGSRSQALSAMLGSYCSGPRVDALIQVPEGRGVIADLAAQCRGFVRDVLASPGQDLYELAGGLAPLGILVELSDAGFDVGITAEVHRAWQESFSAADRQTNAEREFWDDYSARVRLVLARLSPE